MESLTNEKLAVWDYVILTASNDDQAKSYEMQMEDGTWRDGVKCRGIPQN